VSSVLLAWIEGKAATSRNGEVKIETETKAKPDGGETTEAHDKTKLKKGDLAAQPYLGVKSIRVLAGPLPLTFHRMARLIAASLALALLGGAPPSHRRTPPSNGR
jgi:hypothetical protein